MFFKQNYLYQEKTARFEKKTNNTSNMSCIYHIRQRIARNLEKQWELEERGRELERAHYICPEQLSNRTNPCAANGLPLPADGHRNQPGSATAAVAVAAIKYSIQFPTMTILFSVWQEAKKGRNREQLSPISLDYSICIRMSFFISHLCVLFVTFARALLLRIPIRILRSIRTT